MGTIQRIRIILRDDECPCQLFAQGGPKFRGEGRGQGHSHLLALLDRFTVVHGMAHDQEDGDDAGNHGADAAHDQGHAVKCDAAIPEVDLLDCRASAPRF